ncbi:hypothetical protein Spb1_06740 [Planctopirus ephydatiae]|uniref:Uncharacterized protein n=2 Tax=Planctopirus ephydatiae TaxID=2528019 RepID=A0A518GJP7_9PLAN|nr:hypothetical protein Spb1_06740 [Planctopirus ephydatiae]
MLKFIRKNVFSLICQYPCNLALILLLLGLFALAGFRLRDEVLADRISLQMVVKIPDDLPETFFWQTMGNQTVEWNLKRGYPSCYQQGWSECLVEFLWSPRWFTEAPMNPFDQSQGPSLKQLPGLYMDSQKDGWKDCQKQIARFSEMYGTSTVRRILRRKYGVTSWEVRESIHRLHGVKFSVPCEYRSPENL